ncbi:MAG: hypothetical protein BWY74_00158 [Firmicutes bacterium ADurb.Bin419]|nr:MAG: hypothetical protein BWY74_00158 [Firmicutes bacterium ADurb.Bin419]
MRDRFSPITDYNRGRSINCYFGSQIGKKRFENRMMIVDISVDNFDVDTLEEGGKIRLILHADELYKILKYV